ncbi:YcbX family protein [Photobacterium sp.]|uniref:YcbX family protein n=1 Tax=Photobacterium sp. TaxID=660 RepID=UPI00299E8C14|nr:YcbX family protein [Photobacterium sp.]MDX1301369.1 YcbX family protein [Photobacterium sp.]
MHEPVLSQLPILSKISVFPVKSIGGLSLSQAWVEKQGLCFDRRFMVSRKDGSMITARKYSQMVKVTATLQSHGITLSYPGMSPLVLKYANFTMAETNAQVWNDQFIAYTTSSRADAWFSHIIGVDVRLLYTGEQSNRVRAKIQQNVSFADGYPLLVISEASLEALNDRSSQHHTMDQFRTNLVVSGTEAFAEDSWKRIRIGDVEFSAVKPCARCILTTVNPKTAEFDALKEPLATLSRFRADHSGNVYFGQNLVALNEGIIREGDTVEVLETKPKEIYPENSEQNFQLAADESGAVSNETKNVTISIDGNQFQGNNQQPLLEQAENVGLMLANSCRAGLCGACKITLESGKVDQPDVPALLPGDKDNGMVLACCCVPQTDVELRS